MKPNEEAMLKALVAIAWADGHFADEESEILGALIDTLKLDAEGAELIRVYAKEPRTLDDVPVAELSADDRSKLFRHAVILSHIDGGQDDAERTLLAAVAAKLGLGDDEAKALLEQAEEEAKDLLDF